MLQTIPMEFYGNGRIRTEHITDNGDLVGITTYYENGVVQYRTPYKNGSLNGKECVYNEDGCLVLEIEWMNGELHGRIYGYEQDGTIDYIQLYRFGELIDTWEP